MHWLENWIIPPRCVISGESGAGIDLSADVIDSLKKPKAVCPQCCEFSADGGVCGACLAKPPAFERTQVGYYFAGDLIELIHGLKYAKHTAYARLLAELLVEQIESTDVEALIAVPVHQKRWRSRGFNQAQLIAESLGKELNIPVLKHVVSRIKDTPSQTGLTATQREANLKGAFTVDVNKLQGLQNIALVDDVITTGATIRNLAELLKSQTNVGYIEAWAIAKTQ
mgnify:FL=1